MSIVEETKYNKSYKIPICCGQDMKWKGTVNDGLYNGGVALYQCDICGKEKEVRIEPTDIARKKYQNFLKRIQGKSNGTKSKDKNTT